MLYFRLGLIVLLIGTLSMSFAQSPTQVSCPKLLAVKPIVTDIKDLLFIQCAYVGKAIHKKSTNHCKKVYKKLKHRFKKASKTITHWGCYYHPQQAYQYTFTFSLQPKLSHLE